MKQFILNNFWFILVILVAGVLRLYSLGSSPVPLKWDEAALGYNAYSILKTGRDEYGSLLPLVFKSFGDYKPGLYVYSAVLSIMIFGLNEFATRLPSAIFGMMTIICVYFIVKQIFNKQSALSTSFILAISPWHIEFSRGAWESNMAVFLITLGFLFFLLIEKNIKYLWLSAIAFALTYLSYQGAKMFTTMFLGLIFVFFFQKISKFPKKHLILSTCLAVTIIIPIFIGIISGQGGRLKVTSVFSYKRSDTEINKILNQDNISKDSLIFKVFHSESLAFARGIIQRYTDHFSGRFLFFEGDWNNKRLGVPYMGHLYYLDIILLGIGFILLIRNNKQKEVLFLFSWLIISPIPASLTRESVSAVRSLNMVIPLSIIGGVGLSYLVQKIFILRKPYKIFCVLLLAAIYSWNILYFLDQYFIHYSKQFEMSDQYGYKEAVLYANSQDSKYRQIYFTQRYGQPYIYWLFYTQYPPAQYQKQAKLTENPWGDVGIVEHLDNITFKNIYWPEERNCQNCLFIDSDMGIHDEDLLNTPWVKLLSEIKYHNNTVAFRIVESQ